MAISQRRPQSIYAGGISSEQVLVGLHKSLRLATEAVWLTAAFLVPLIVLSEHEFTSFTELPKITLMRSLASVGLIFWLTLALIRSSFLHTLDNTDARLPSRRKGRWILEHQLQTSVTLVLVVTFLSTLLSIQPSVSLLGAEWGRDGYDLYTVFSYVVLFFLAADGIKKRGQLARLWTAVAVSGIFAALVAIAQHFALSPFGISGTYYHQRVTGTVGNPLFLGALFTVTLPMGVAIMLAGATSAFRWFGGSRLWWIATTVLVFVYAYAALFTASRGPWIGMGTALVILVLLTARATSLRTAGLAAASISVGMLLAISLVLGPGSSSIESFAVAEQQELYREQSQVSEAAVAPLPAKTAIEMRGDQGTIERRFAIWSTSSSVIVERPRLPESNNAPWIVRQVFGYGPDTFRFVFPTRAPGDLLNTLTSSAHNAPLTWIVETGLLGLLSHLVLLISIGLVVWKLTARKNRKFSLLLALLAAGVGAGVIGRLFEQMSGVPQVSDTTVSWLAIAALASAYTIWIRHAEPTDEVVLAADDRKRRFAMAHPLFSIPIGVTVVGMLVYAIFVYNINLLRADMRFHEGNATLATGNPALAIDLMQSAIELNPTYEHYSHQLADVFHVNAEESLELVSKLEWLTKAYNVESAAYAANPTSRSANFELAFASWELAQMGSPGKAEATLQSYERLSELAPNHPLVIDRLEKLRAAVLPFSASS